MKNLKERLRQTLICIGVLASPAIPSYTYAGTLPSKESSTHNQEKDVVLDLSGRGQEVTDEDLRDLPSGLTTLKLKGCEKITGNGLRSLPKTLTRLNLYDCQQITGTDLKYLEEIPLTKLVLGQFYNSKNFRDEGLRYLPQTLTKLRLKNCRKITDSGVLILVSRCPKLIYLDLKDCHAITDVGLLSLEKLPKLSTLRLINGKKLVGEKVSKYLAWLSKIPTLPSDLIELIKKQHIEPRDLETVGASSASELKLLALCANRVKGLTVGNSVDNQEEFIPTDSDVQYIAENFPNLNLLSLFCCGAITSNGFKIIAESFPKLRSLCLWETKVTNDDLKVITMHHPDLVEIHLLQCPQITDDGLQAIVEHCTELTTLSLTGTSVTDTGLLCLNKLPKLTQLSTHSGEQLKGEKIGDYLERFSTLLKSPLSIELAGFLTKHRIKPEEIGTKCIEASPSDLRLLIPFAKAVTSLRLIHDRRDPVTDADLQYVSENYTSVTALSIKGCDDITSQGLDYLTTLSGLRSLHLPRYEQLYGENIKERIKNLVASDKVAAFLKKRYIEPKEVSRKCIRVYASDLDILALLADEITSLSLQPDNTDSNIPSTRFPNLTHLYMPPQITNTGLRTILQNCPKLTHLWLSGCDRITNTQAIVECCPNITTLFLDDTGVTDVEIQRISQHCRNLVSLNLKNTQITCSGLLHLARLPNLQYLASIDGKPLEGGEIESHLSSIKQ